MRILLWPFRIVYAFISFIFSLLGRVVAFALGLALIIAGIVISCTVVGAVVGVPLTVVGIPLFVRALF